MYAGTGRAVITPPLGTELAGYGFRDHGAEGVLDDLEVRVLWLQPGDDPRAAVCIVSADLIGFGDRLTAGIRSALTARSGLPPERVLLAASHTHSGPQTCENMVGCGRLNEAVVGMVRARTVEAIEQAARTLDRVTMRAGRGRCTGYAVNRRLVQDGQVRFMANPDGVRDDEVITLACHDAATGAIRAVLFHFACHPTLMGDYRISADYPGAARRHIESALGEGAAALFLPGCFGDIRPYCTYVGGKQFRRGLPEDVALFGQALGTEVLRVAQGDTHPLAPQLDARAMKLDLPVRRHPDRAELEDILQNGPEDKKAWAAYLLSNPFSPTRPLTLQRIDLAANARLVVLGGEICCDYGHFVKRLNQDAFMVPVGYANGMTGYIPSARLFVEGGYEPDTSCPYFGLPAPFRPDIEETICQAIRKL